MTSRCPFTAMASTFAIGSMSKTIVGISTSSSRRAAGNEICRRHQKDHPVVLRPRRLVAAHHFRRIPAVLPEDVWKSGVSCRGRPKAFSARQVPTNGRRKTVAGMGSRGWAVRCEPLEICQTKAGAPRGRPYK